MLSRLKSGLIRPYFRCALLLGALVALSGCATRPLYAPPSGLTPVMGATLLGSKNGESLLFAERTYVIGVDGRSSGLGPGDYHSALLLAPGVHSIDIGFSGIGAPSSIATGVTLEASRTYIAECSRQDRGGIQCSIHTPDGIMASEPMRLSPQPASTLIPVMVK
jgi:hypothetical protein